jgi:AmmeMemoRadiSam system protein B
MVQSLAERVPRLFGKLDTDRGEIEHALEMAFPLLKFVFKPKEFRIVPVMAGAIDFAKCQEVAAALATFANNTTLFVTLLGYHIQEGSVRLLHDGSPPH